MSRVSRRNKPIIRQRKQGIILAGFLGAFIAAIPFSISNIRMSFGQEDMKKKVIEYEAQINRFEDAQVYVLIKSKKERDTIEKEDVRLTTVRIQTDDLYIRLQKSNPVDRICGMELKQGTILYESMSYEGKIVEDNIRKKDFYYITLSDQLKKDDLVDIRIMYPNGEDYIVARRKRVQEMIQENVENPTNKLTLLVSEEEILRFASAYVDLQRYEGCVVYTTSYITLFQEEAIVNYPVNPDVFALMQWNPNMNPSIISPKEEEKRKNLQENLLRYETVGQSNSNSEAYTNDIQQKQVSEIDETKHLETFE